MPTHHRRTMTHEGDGWYQRSVGENLLEWWRASETNHAPHIIMANNMLCSAAMVSARKSRPAPMRFLYRLVLPTAVAAYSNVNHRGYLTRQFTRSHHVVSTYANKKLPLPSNDVLVAHNNYPVQTVVTHRAINSSLKSTDTKSEDGVQTTLSTADIEHMKLAARLARIGKGNTYPNPAVGCVLVRHETEDEIVGSGFHPRYVFLAFEEFCFETIWCFTTHIYITFAFLHNYLLLYKSGQECHTRKYLRY